MIVIIILMMTVVIIMVVIISCHDQYFLAGRNAKDATVIVIMNHGNAEGNTKMVIMTMMLMQRML